jgi:hypothetical protein
MRIRCPHCQQELCETNVNENAGWGQCPDCNGIFRLREDLIISDTPQQPELNQKNCSVVERFLTDHTNASSELNRKNCIVIEQDDNTLTAFFPPPRGFFSWIFFIGTFFYFGIVTFILLVPDPDFPPSARIFLSSFFAAWAAFGLSVSFFSSREQVSF